MTNETRISAIIAACALLAPAGAMAQAAWQYQLIDYPGAPQTQVFGINDHGSAVGTAYDDLDTYPFLYDVKKARFTDLANVAGYDLTSFIGISDSGRLVGSVVLGEEEMGLSRDVQGADTVFSHPDALYTQARGVNNKGLISGFRVSSDGGLGGFVYDPKAGTFTDIAPSLSTIAHGMNSQGDVVGSAVFASFAEPEDPCPGLPGDPDIRRYGWLRTADGALTYFTVSENPTVARGINDRRQIAGYVTDGSGVGARQKGFVIEGKKFAGAACVEIAVATEDFLEVPGFLQTLPEGLSNSGIVVGVTTELVDEVTGETVSHGFVATPR